MPKRFQFIEHTADIGVRSSGDNLAEAFANAADGLFSIITDVRKIRRTESVEVVIEAADIEGLLFKWMNHLIYLFDVQHLLLKQFDITELTARQLKVICRGEKYDPARHEIKLGVKSATYHQLKVDKIASTVQVIFDV